MTFTSATSIKITLSVADQSVAGTYPVVVTNPAPGGGSSTPVNYTVNNLAPTVTSLSPASGATGSASLSVTITGTNFVPTSTVTYNSVAHAVTYVSATSLTLPLNAADLATAGTYPVVVTNPAPAGGSSAPVNFTVGTAPSITSANHATFIAGTNSQFQVTATGNPAPTFAVTAGKILAFRPDHHYRRSHQRCGQRRSMAELLLCAVRPEYSRSNLEAVLGD